MKLLLVNPYFKGGVYAPSLGLGFIGTYVRDHSDFEVELVEPAQQGLLNEREVLNKAKKADIVGLTCYTESRFQCFDFAKKVKLTNPSCKLIVGGPHVNTLDEATLRHYPFIDVVVRGEGEVTMLDIVKNKPPKEILGITWRNGEKIIRNPDRSVIKNIDSLYYDYSLAPHLKGWKDLEVPHKLEKVNHLPIIASRGCPFRCTFCAAHMQWGGVCRALSPEELVKRTEYLVGSYNVGCFRFYDALFLGGNPRRILKFCDLLEKSKLDVSFRIDLRIGTTRNVLEKLRKVGCDVVGMGIESGSDKVLKRINKGITRELIDKSIKICRELGFWMMHACKFYTARIDCHLRISIKMR